MSLLLEALKKAEKAKEEAQRRARASEDAADPEATVLDEGRRVMTRDELPDISAPLEILSDDLRAAEAPRQPLDLDRIAAPAPASVPEPAPARREREPGRAAAPSPSAEERPAPTPERTVAKKVFEAKIREPNPKLPFYITMAVLGVACVGTAIYFYLQLRPPPPLVNTNPQRPKEENAVAQAAAPAAQASAAPSAPAAIPGLPDNPAGTSATPQSATVPAAPQSAAAPPAVSAAPAQSKPAPAPAQAPTPTTAPPPAAAQAKPAPTAPAKPAASSRAEAQAGKSPSSPSAPRAASRPAAAPAPKGEDQPLSVNRGGPQIHPQVAAGYAAYQAGDLSRARNEYQQALREEPVNRDALLGLAAVEMRAQRFDLADGYYTRLLQIDPRDPHAQAGMLALRGQQLDPVAVESRVKSMLAVNPEANVLQFTLGNQYAQQGRWAEAQQAYFRAFTADPENPDIAYNLAVSLDQLNQPKPALEYYRRALSLSERRGASFPTDLARARVQQLTR